MAEGTQVRVRKDGSVTISDLSAGNTYTRAFSDGSFDADTPGDTIQEFLDNGCHTSPPTLRKVAEGVSTITFTAYFRDATDAGEMTIMDIAYNSGFYAASWTSTLGASAEVKTVDITFTAAAVGGELAQTILFQHCRLTASSLSSNDPMLGSFTFTSHETYPTPS